MWLIAMVSLATWGCEEDPARTAHGGDAEAASAHQAGGAFDGAQASDAALPRSQLDASVTEADAQAEREVAPIVQTRAGALRGVRMGAVLRYLSIPYAQPPTGARRFASPEPVASWSGVRDVRVLGPHCPQVDARGQPQSAQSEDCLTLSVYRRAEMRGRPVVVFLHGGTFAARDGTPADPAQLAERSEVVVVTVNYRLGALGFFAHAALDADGKEPSGNQGLRDQQLAMRWVQENIRAFDGDEGNVTVVGSGAGAVSACLLLASPTAQEFGARMAIQSGSCLGGFPLSERVGAEARALALVERVCAGQQDVLGCLRAAPVSSLVSFGSGQSAFGAGWGPVIRPDDPLLPRHPGVLLTSGDVGRRSLIMGSNEADAVGFGDFADSLSDSEAALRGALARGFGEQAVDSIWSHYQVDGTNLKQAFRRLLTDAVFRCPTRALARLASDQGHAVYLYQLVAPPAEHGHELSYVFATPNPRFGPLLPPLAAAVRSYWYVFALGGGPNYGPYIEWPYYDARDDRHLVLGAEMKAGSGLGRADCDFWDALGYDWNVAALAAERPSSTL